MIAISEGYAQPCEWGWSNPTNPSIYTHWGDSSSDWFFAGAHGTIFHYDGSTWSWQISGTSMYLYDMYGLSSTDIFVCGDDGILHYDGSVWSSYDLGAEYNKVWGNSPSEVFAAGGFFTYDYEKTLKFYHTSFVLIVVPFDCSKEFQVHYSVFSDM